MCIIVFNILIFLNYLCADFFSNNTFLCMFFFVNYFKLFKTHFINSLFRTMSSMSEEELILEKQRKREELKRKALNFYNELGVSKNIEQILNEILYEKPSDVYGRLVSFLQCQVDVKFTFLVIVRFLIFFRSIF